MKARCIINRYSNLAEKYRPYGESDGTVYHLTIDKEYQVYGISIYKSELNYLVMDETRKPNWYSVGCFELTNNQIPPDWFFKHFLDNEEFLLNAIWGYQELVESQSHYEGILERDYDELVKFHQMVMKREKEDY